MKINLPWICFSLIFLGTVRGTWDLSSVDSTTRHDWHLIVWVSIVLMRRRSLILARVTLEENSRGGHGWGWIYISEESSYRKSKTLSALGSQTSPSIFANLSVHSSVRVQVLSSGVCWIRECVVLKTETRVCSSLHIVNLYLLAVLVLFSISKKLIWSRGVRFFERVCKKFALVIGLHSGPSCICGSQVSLEDVASQT
jgi:hypothetical protein